jgi:hypothetical protein
MIRVQAPTRREKIFDKMLPILHVGLKNQFTSQPKKIVENHILKKVLLML